MCKGIIHYFMSGRIFCFVKKLMPISEVSHQKEGQKDCSWSTIGGQSIIVVTWLSFQLRHSCWLFLELIYSSLLYL